MTEKSSWGTDDPVVSWGNDDPSSDGVGTPTAPQDGASKFLNWLRTYASQQERAAFESWFSSRYGNSAVSQEKILQYFDENPELRAFASDVPFRGGKPVTNEGHRFGYSTFHEGTGGGRKAGQDPLPTGSRPEQKGGYIADFGEKYEKDFAAAFDKLITPEAPGPKLPAPKYDVPPVTVEGNPPTLNPEREVTDLGQRFTAGVLYPSDRVLYWRGKGHQVYVGPKGELYLWDEQKSEWYPVDIKSGMLAGLTHLSDWADASGDIGEAVVSVPFRATPVGQAMGGAAGSAARSVISGMILSETPDAGAMAGRAAEAAIGGAVSQHLINISVAGAKLGYKAATNGTKELLTPALTEEAKRFSREAMLSHFTRERAALAEEMGLVMTPAMMMTRDRPTTSLEAMMRRDPVGASFVRKNAERNQGLFLNRYEATLAQLGSAGGPTGPAQSRRFGEVVAKSSQQVVDGAARARDINAEENFAKLDELLGDYGHKRWYEPQTLGADPALADRATGVPVLRLDDFPSFQDSVLNVIGKKLDVQNIAPGERAAAERLFREAVSFDDGLSYKSLANKLSFWSDAAAGKSSLFRDAMPLDDERAVAKQILGALKSDLDRLAAQHPEAEALRAARDAYFADSTGIKTFQQTELGRYFDNAFRVDPESGTVTFTKNGEDVARIIRNLSPSEREHLSVILDDAFPRLRDRIVGDEMRRILWDAFPENRLSTTRAKPALDAQKLANDLQKSPIYDTMPRATREKAGWASQAAAALSDEQALISAFSGENVTPGKARGVVANLPRAMMAAASGRTTLALIYSANMLGGLGDTMRRGLAEALATPEGVDMLARVAMERWDGQGQPPPGYRLLGETVARWLERTATAAGKMTEPGSIEQAPFRIDDDPELLEAIRAEQEDRRLRQAAARSAAGSSPLGPAPTR